MKEVDMCRLTSSNLCFLLVCLLLPLLFGACMDKTPSKETLKKELKQTVAEFNKAFKEGDKNQIKSFIAEQYIHSNGTSKAIDRTTWLNYITKREQQIKSGEIVIKAYQMTEQKLLLYDNYGIVTGKVSVEGVNKNGDFKNVYRVTNIWIKENGKWKRTGFHDGKIQN